MEEQEYSPMARIDGGDQYKKMLLDMWEVIKTYESKVRAFYLQVAPMLQGGLKPQQIPIDNEQQDNINNLISLSLGLWEELEPKMRGKDDNQEFMKFEGFLDEPLQFLVDTNKVFNLVKQLRNSLEVLGITKIEKELK